MPHAVLDGRGVCKSPTDLRMLLLIFYKNCLRQCMFPVKQYSARKSERTNWPYAIFYNVSRETSVSSDKFHMKHFKGSKWANFGQRRVKNRLFLCWNREKSIKNRLGEENLCRTLVFFRILWYDRENRWSAVCPFQDRSLRVGQWYCLRISTRACSVLEGQVPCCLLPGSVHKLGHVPSADAAGGGRCSRRFAVACRNARSALALFCRRLFAGIGGQAKLDASGVLRLRRDPAAAGQCGYCLKNEKTGILSQWLPADNAVFKKHAAAAPVRAVPLLPNRGDGNLHPPS